MGGRLVYSTCSLLSDENEQRAENFLATHPDYRLLNAAEILSTQQINLDTGKYLKLLPHLHNTDGFFAAVFEKIDATTPAKKSSPVQTEVEALPAEIATKKTVAKTNKTVKEKVTKPKMVKPKVVKAKIAKA